MGRTNIKPVIGPDDEYFWDGVQGGRIQLRRCGGCGELQHPPMPTPMCGTCHSLEWQVVEASGRGTVYTWIISHHPSGQDDDERIVALIELDEGVRLISNLHDVDPGDVHNDMAVEAFFLDVGDDLVLPQFRPAATTKA